MALLFAQEKPEDVPQSLNPRIARRKAGVRQDEKTLQPARHYRLLRTNMVQNNLCVHTKHTGVYPYIPIYVHKTKSTHS